MPSLRIKPFPAPVSQDHVRNTWDALRDAVEGILQNRAPKASFEYYYQQVYDMLLHKHGEELHRNLREVLSYHLQNSVNANLHRNITTNLLPTLRQVWENYMAQLADIEIIFMYMDRKIESLPTGYETIRNMGLGLFNDIVLHRGQVRDIMQRTVITMISHDRMGASVDRQLIKSICAMLMTLGGESRTVYEDNFEKAFLDESVQFLQRQGVEFLATGNASDCIRKMDGLIKAENQRLDAYLDPSTKDGLNRIIDEQLIERNIETIVSMPNGGTVSLVRTKNYTDLALMYRLLNRVPQGVPAMIAPISRALREEGAAIMNSPQATKQPVQLIQSLLNIKADYDSLLEKGFRRDIRFKKAIIADFEHFFNLNKRCAEFLSLYIDDQLKNGLRTGTDAQMAAVLEQCMTLFRCIQEKDVFERFYKHHLARRLINSRTTSDDTEKAMLAQLRAECGYSYTSKLEGMYRDMISSGNLNEKFKDHCFKNNDLQDLIEISVHVLTSGFWPMQPAPSPITLPPSANKAYNEFKSYFLEHHSGRQLTLQHSLGSVEMAAEFHGEPAVDDRIQPSTMTDPKFTRRYLLLCNTYQMCVMMLFNQQSTLSYQDLATLTNIPDKDLKRTVASLTSGKSKLLFRVNAAKASDTFVQFAVNENFYSPQYRVKVNTVSRMESEEEKKDGMQES